jgi:hypothetical protein
MRKIIIRLLLILSLHSLQAQDKNVEAEIRKLEQLEVEAIMKNDTVTLSKLWDKDYVVNAPDNMINHAGKSVTNRPVLNRPRLGFVRNVEGISINGNVAFAMGNETVTHEGNQAGKQVTVKRRYTNVWILKNDAWKLSARHANILCR